ncbi:hypothetical protein T439DRAFT_354751 [Meredithblackwellia eburnea MCA 4105]
MDRTRITALSGAVVASAWNPPKTLYRGKYRRVEEVVDTETYDHSIKWNTPELKEKANGICGEQFRVAYSCWSRSVAKPKDKQAECAHSFSRLHICENHYGLSPGSVAVA